MNEQERQLLGIINASGFLFQLKLEEELRRTEPERQNRWHYVAREYKWHSQESDNEGFADLLLESGIARMVVECKRVTDAKWIFLVQDGAPEVNTATFLWTRSAPEGPPLAAYDSFAFEPRSFQAAFCVVRGQGENDQPMMERLATYAQEATRGVADQELSIERNRDHPKIHVFLPSIITNAKLFACEFDAAAMDLSSGRLDAARFTEVPFIRFHKSLSVSVPRMREQQTLRDTALAYETTVLVMNAMNAAQTLKKMQLPFTGSWPWSGI
jgi:hypothetical protein